MEEEWIMVYAYFCQTQVPTATDECLHSSAILWGRIEIVWTDMKYLKTGTTLLTRKTTNEDFQKTLCFFVPQMATKVQTVEVGILKDPLFWV